MSKSTLPELQKRNLELEKKNSELIKQNAALVAKNAALVEENMKLKTQTDLPESYDPLTFGLKK